MTRAGVPETAVADVASRAPVVTLHTKRRFWVGMAALATLVSGAGFVPSLLDHSSRVAPVSMLGLAHAVAFGGWLLLFLTQAALVAAGRTTVHRRLGMFGPWFAAAVILLSYALVIEFGRRGYDLSGDVTRSISRSGSRARDASGILFPLAELLDFAVLVAAGLWYRHRTEIHKRLMLLAVIVVINEPVIHLVGHLAAFWPILRGTGVRIGPPVTLLLLSSSAVHDLYSHRRLHPVSVWVPVLLFAWQDVVAIALLRSAAWHNAAAWLIR